MAKYTTAEHSSDMAKRKILRQQDDPQRLALSCLIERSAWPPRCVDTCPYGDDKRSRPEHQKNDGTTYAVPVVIENC